MIRIQPIIMTPDLPRLQAFYERLLGAVQTERVPEQGPAFFVGLTVGDSRLGLVSEETADLAAPPRMLLSVDVGDVDLVLGQVEPAGGRVQGPANDMPWGQRVAHITDPDGNLVNLTQDL